MTNENSKKIKGAAKDIRASGVNLDKIWRIMASLRSSTQGNETFSFPDPLPAPSSMTARSTRSMRGSSSSSSIHVATSAQMVPVAIALIEEVLSSEVVRTEIDDGVKDARETIREAREAMKKENERWENEKKQLDVLDQKAEVSYFLMTSTSSLTSLKHPAHQNQSGTQQSQAKIARSGVLAEDCHARVHATLFSSWNRQRRANVLGA